MITLLVTVTVEAYHQKDEGVNDHISHSSDPGFTIETATAEKMVTAETMLVAATRTRVVMVTKMVLYW